MNSYGGGLLRVKVTLAVNSVHVPFGAELRQLISKVNQSRNVMGH